MEEYSGKGIVNIGCGEDQYRELAELVKEVTGYAGNLVLIPSKPDGTPISQIVDVSKINALGWRYKTPLEKEYGLPGFFLTFQKPQTIQ